MAKTRNPENENTNSVDFGMLSGMLIVMALLGIAIAYLGVKTTDSLLQRDCEQYNQAQACLDLADRVGEPQATELRRRAGAPETAAEAE